MEERARGDAELVPAGVAVPFRAALEPEQAGVLGAARALDAAGPAEVAEVGAALLLEVVVARCARKAEPGGDLGSEDAEIGRNLCAHDEAPSDRGNRNVDPEPGRAPELRRSARQPSPHAPCLSAHNRGVNAAGDPRPIEDAVRNDGTASPGPRQVEPAGRRGRRPASRVRSPTCATRTTAWCCRSCCCRRGLRAGRRAHPPAGRSS